MANRFGVSLSLGWLKREGWRWMGEGERITELEGIHPLLL